MKAKTLEKWVKLLAYIYYHPNCEMPTARRELQLKDRGMRDTINAWIIEGIIIKVKRDEIVMGKPRIFLSLTPKGEELFFRLKEVLNKKQKNNS